MVSSVVQRRLDLIPDDVLSFRQNDLRENVMLRGRGEEACGMTKK